MTTTLKSPILLTQDSVLIDQIQHLCSTLNLGLDCVDNPFLAHSHWSEYPYVLIGADLAGECIDSHLPRRPGVALVHRDVDVNATAGSDTSQWERHLWQQALAIGAENVVALPSSEFWLRDALACITKTDESQGELIAVIPGSGGVGASTFSVNLGFRAVQRGFRTLLVDADPLGGGIDLVLGAEEVVGTRWPDVDPGGGRIAAQTLESALPVFQGLKFLSHARANFSAPRNEVLAAVIDAGRRAFDLVIVDLPRSGELATELIVGQAATTIIPVRNHVRSVSAAAQLHKWVREVRGQAQFVLLADNKGVSATDVGLALGDADLVEIPLIPSMSTRADEGDIPSITAGYSQFCDRILGELPHVIATKAA
jgi:secretion/DNA translocation related CpaE-like protein